MTSSTIAAFGIDLGSEATFLVSSKADIVRNELGGHASGSLVAFSGDERVVGEAAVGQASGNPKNTISQLHQLVGATYESFESLPLAKHLVFKRKPDGGEGNKLNIEVAFGSETEKTFAAEPVVGMLLAKLKRLAQTQLAGQGEEPTNVCFAFGVPPWYGPSERRALEDAAIIGGLGNSDNTPQVLLMDTPLALARVLAKKHPVLGGEPPRDHLVIDVGSSHVTMFVCRIHPDGFAPNGQNYELLSCQCERTCGVANMDALLFDLMQKKAQEKVGNSSTGSIAAPASKAGARLLKAVDRTRRLLGTMPTAEVTVENIAEDTDVNLSVSRNELSEICAPLIEKFKKLLATTIETSGVKPDTFSSVEILGGGSRMPIIHEAIMEVMNNKDLAFGQKLDSSAIAYGAALLMKAFLSSQSIPTTQEKESAASDESPVAANEESAATAPTTTTSESTVPVEKCPNTSCKCPDCTCGAGCTCGISNEVSCDPCNEFKANMMKKKMEEEAAAAAQPSEAVNNEKGSEGEANASPEDMKRIVSEFAHLTTSQTGADQSVTGLSVAELAELSQQEEKMFQADEVLALIRAKKNEIESYVLTMRSAPHQKHGGSINVSELEKVLDEVDNWSYSDEAYSADAATVTAKLDGLKQQVEALCSEYFDAVNKERLEKEKEMEEEAKRAEQEKFENGDDEDNDKVDKDNRRLTKTERMKKVMKHKETGTELFKGKNYVHAAKHYKDALTHCTKFFDLSAGDLEEVKAVKLTLYLNLATCWTKLDNLDQVMKCASDALSIDPNSAKALYRRAFVHEKRKEFDKAKSDLNLASKQPGSENDSAIATLIKRVDIQIKREKEKEKKMYGKMFS